MPKRPYGRVTSLRLRAEDRAFIEKAMRQRNSLTGTETSFSQFLIEAALLRAALFNIQPTQHTQAALENIIKLEAIQLNSLKDKK